MLTAPDKTPLQVENNAVITYTDSAKAKFRLTAPRLETYGGTDPYEICPNGMVIDFFDDSMHISSHVSANYGIRHEKTQIMEADNKVVVVNKKGEQLNTEQLFWDANKHTIYTNKYVIIKTTSEILYGTGLTSNEDFSNYKITNISGTVKLKTSDKQ